MPSSHSARRYLGLAGGLASPARSIPRPQLELELSVVRLLEHVELALHRIAQEGPGHRRHPAATPR